MYEVGPWFLHLMNLAIIAIVALVIFIVADRKRGQYQHEAVQCIQAEIKLPTGFSLFHTIPCDINAKTVTIGNFTYFLNPEKRSWGVHPRVPFMGLRRLQVPIRKETWYQDNAVAIQEPNTDPEKTLSAAEIRAIQREGKATSAAMESQEIEARQVELTKAISNQANKTVTYILAGVNIVLSLIIVVQVVMGGL